MPSLALVSRINVLTAIRDHDLQGVGPFLEGLGFSGPGEEVLVERGRRYDARGLLSYAHGKATGTPLTPEQITLGSLKVLADLGFTVAFREDLDRPKSAPVARIPGTRTPVARAKAPARTPAAPKPRVSRAAPAKPEPVIKLCPSCFTQLSMAGTCDFCE